MLYKVVADGIDLRGKDENYIIPKVTEWVDIVCEGEPTKNNVVEAFNRYLKLGVVRIHSVVNTQQ
jgi:hypothetical protein|tara:strand:- start:486 stop:680 length:195 start_codon:yes stop_codon:yes gene_type:complete